MDLIEFTFQRLIWKINTITMKGNVWMESYKDTGEWFGGMGRIMKEIGTMTKWKDRVSLFGETADIILGNIKMIKKMDSVQNMIKMIILCKREIGKKINLTNEL